jgi:hypothetical protein
MAPFREALNRHDPLPIEELPRPGWTKKLPVRKVPAPESRPPFLAHPRLRRTSPITRYAVAAGLEALGTDSSAVKAGALRLGIVMCVLSGCVNYSRRFYDETLQDPASASPLIFPETVFNAPASHLGALLETPALNYTLVGDAGTFLAGLAIAGNWLFNREVDGCLVIGAEEMDWLSGDAFRLFFRGMIMAEGAGAVYLAREMDSNSPLRLNAITDSHCFLDKQSRKTAAARVRAELPPYCPTHLLCDSTQNIAGLDAAERTAWRDWTGARLAPKSILGEGLAASSAWQCVAAIDALEQNRYTAAHVSVIGGDQQAIGASFAKLKL